MEVKVRCFTEQQCQNMFRGVEDSLYVIGGKWKLKIIIALITHSRFNEILRKVNGISSKVLSNELKDLEINGFVTRHDYKLESPARIEYLLTEHVETLEPVIVALKEWGIMHRKTLTKK